MRRFTIGSMFYAIGLLLVPGLGAQEEQPTVYTFVAEWAVPRDQWSAYEGAASTTMRPILEKLAADGTLVGWGTYATVVHEQNGNSHGIWFTATSIAAIERARGSLLQGSSGMTMLANAGHWDFLMSSDLYGGGSATASGAYLHVSSVMVQPGKGNDWEELWKKYNRPVYDGLIKDGSLLAYSIDTQDIHTMNPRYRFIVTVTPSAEGEDKVGAAFDAAGQKRSEMERDAIFKAFTEVQDRDQHRDYFARVTAYWHK